MKKYFLVLFIAAMAAAPFFLFKNTPRIRPVTPKQPCANLESKPCQKDLLKYLKLRKDALALSEADKVLAVEPDDLCAWWVRAEVMRRTYKFRDSEDLLRQILAQHPTHIPSLISLAYIEYHDDKFDDASKILKQLLSRPDLSLEDRAIVYMLMGSINAKKSLGGLFYKIAYGTRIKGHFEKALVLAPDLAEVRLGLGTFYLLAPGIAGGNIDKAILELEYAVKLTPDFATANARLAQAYKKKGDLEKYNFYLQRAKELDPGNEVVEEVLRIKD
jgi:tetratricopeptide (TPR) repeat protein